MTAKRTSQVVVESVSQADPALLASQVAVEVVSSNALKMLVSQVIVEMVSENVPDDTGVTQPQLLVVAT